MNKLFLMLLLSISLVGCGNTPKEEPEKDLTVEEKILNTEFTLSLNDNFLLIEYNADNGSGYYDVACYGNKCYFKFGLKDSYIFYQVDIKAPAIYQTRAEGAKITRTVANLSKHLTLDELTSAFINDSTIVSIDVEEITNFKEYDDFYSFKATVTAKDVEGNKSKHKGTLHITKDLQSVISFQMYTAQCSTTIGTTSLAKDSEYLEVEKTNWNTLTQTDMLELFQADLSIGVMDMLAGVSNSIAPDDSDTNTPVEESTSTFEDTTEFRDNVNDLFSYDNKYLKGSEVKAAIENLYDNGLALVVINGDSSATAFNYGQILSNSTIDYDGYIVCEDIWTSYLTEDINDDLVPLRDAGSDSFLHTDEEYYSSLLTSGDKVIGILFQMTAESIDKVFN